MLLKEIFGGHPLAADIHCVDAAGIKATPSFSHPVQLYKWLKEHGYRELPRSDSRHDHVLGVYERPGQLADATNEHVIAYAYPGSASAQKLGCAKKGCFTVSAKGKTTACASLKDAVQAVSTLGTVPGRWSIDHPANAQMTGFQASRKEACHAE